MQQIDIRIDQKKNIIEEYLRVYEYYQQKYDKDKLMVFMQVGQFHEGYQIIDKGPILQNVANIINMIVSKKNKSINEVSIKNPYMLGFPSSCLSKYLKIMVDNNYTVIIIDQVSQPPNPIREITGIYSQGIYISDNNTNNETMNIILIYLEENKDIITKIPILSSGLSIIDLSTGKIIINEIYGQSQDDKYTLDQIIKFINSYQVKKVILINNNIQIMDNLQLEQYLELQDKSFYHYQYDQYIKLKDKIIKPFEKIQYQQVILQKAYDMQQTDMIQTLELENLIYGRISLCLLIDYIYEYNPNIIKKLNRPEFYSQSQYLNISHNSISQLNLITYDVQNISNIYSEKCNYKSLFDILNKTSTPMGKRLLKQNILQPFTDINKIQKYYDIIEQMQHKYNEILQLDKQLLKIQDIERLLRKMGLQLLNPIDLYNLINSIDGSITIINQLSIHNIFIEDIEKYNDIVQQNINFLLECKDIFMIEELQKYLINEIDGQIFQNNKYKDIDMILDKINDCNNMMQILSKGLSQYLDNLLNNKSQNNKGDQLVKIEQTDREGHYIQLTKRRAEVLQKQLEQDKQIQFEYNNKTYVIKYDQLEFKHLPKGNNSKIFFPMLQNNSTQLIDYIVELKKLNKQYFNQKIISLFSKYNLSILSMINIISQFDYLKSGCLTSIQNHYFKPQIKDIQNGKSYMISKQLRHPIIEQININNEYIPIDIKLGIENQDGILLYGLNSAGKSSLQKSIGISIIMAQMGYYVSSEQYEYYPYQCLMTRINSNDNLFKGLSSFTLELVELRSILKRSDKNTLVIADEVCKGTEHQSSIIIVASMIKILCQNETSFITATHLHELTQIEQIKQINNLQIYHLHIEYNEQTNELIYDRILKQGQGQEFYGYTISKHFIYDQQFLQISTQIKNELFNNQFVNSKQSKYNNNIYMDQCFICRYKPQKNQIPLETHHITFQKNFINGINNNKKHIKKNQQSNLVVLCHKCHDDIDSDTIIIKKWEQTNKGNKLNYNFK